jgi:Protein of unknown function (DUF732)
MKITIIAALAVSAAIGSAVAHADPDGSSQRAQQQFSSYMSAHGVSDAITEPGMPVYSALAEGQQVCTAFKGGASQQSQIAYLEGLMGRAQSELIVKAAQLYLCPGA